MTKKHVCVNSKLAMNIYIFFNCQQYEIGFSSVTVGIYFEHFFHQTVNFFSLFAVFGLEEAFCERKDLRSSFSTLFDFFSKMFFSQDLGVLI